MSSSTRTRRGAMALAAIALAAVATAPLPVASADPPPRTTIAPATPATPVAGTDGGSLTPGLPEWLPLRLGIGDTPIKVGCTYDSHGSQFGYECSGHHDRWALDLIADAGTPVYAAGAGFATNGTGAAGGSGYGNNVRIDHGNGVQTIYAHLSKVLVPAEGAFVDQNTEIGLVGSTGSSSANHLHYEVRATAPDGSVAPVDPGPLKACVLGQLVTYPQAGGYDSWKGLPWGAFTLGSQGTDCATPPPAPVAAAAAPARDDEVSATSALEAGAAAARKLAAELPAGFLRLAGQARPRATD